MSTLSVAIIRDVQSFDFSNTEFAKAFDVANAAFDQSNTAAIIANTTNTFAYGVAVNAAAAFNKANNALANTSGTFAGNLVVTGNLALGGISSTIYPLETPTEQSTATSLRVRGRPTSNDSAIRWYSNDGATQQGYVQFGGQAEISVVTNDSLIIKTNSTTRMMIQSTGNVGIGTTSPSVSLDVGSKTDAIIIPVGTTAQRPVGASGMIRMNSTTGAPEWYSATGSSWIPFSDLSPYSVEYIVVAGGGGGGVDRGGGGGAGGYLISNTTVVGATSYTVTVGGGGAGASGGNGIPVAGSNSVFGSITALGGGRGGTFNASNRIGGNGGSGGGGNSGGSLGGSGTAGQGYAGGQGSSGGTGAGGGGGSGSVGVSPSAGTLSGGNGGSGTSDTWTGSGRSLAGGGGGAGGSGSAGSGQAGGGNGTAGDNSSTGGSASSNSGSGGGGGTGGGGGGGGNGGSGIVIIRYLGAQRGSGGTVTSSGGYTLHTFTSSSTFTA